ncbi:MAG TPA: beta-ketoacyl-[acyl-carrier-protein] synthase family protein, partial [Tepidisphaeraceae bacterium]
MTDANTQILITGAGLMTPLGLGREATWQAILNATCAMAPLSAIESPLNPNKGGGQCPEIDTPKSATPATNENPDARGSSPVARVSNPCPTAHAFSKQFEHAPREVRYLSRAIREALDHAGLSESIPYPPDRCGIMLGTTLHGMRAAGQYLRTSDFSFLRHFLANSTLHEATQGLPFNAFAATTCSACSSGLGSIALAVTLLRTGQLDCVITGGYDTISEYAYAGFNSLRLVAEDAIRPFARGRQGMKVSEGYGILILERADDAARRHATPLARIAGFGESADAHHLTQPHPQGEGAARAMRACLEAAGIDPQDLSLISAHATATPDNDAGEYAALAQVFADRLPDIPVVAYKSMLGHTLGGAGAVELILNALALRDQQIPPTCN